MLVADEPDYIDDNKRKKMNANIVKNVEKVQKVIPKAKGNYKHKVKIHTMNFEHLISDDSRGLLNMIIFLYLKECQAHKDSEMLISGDAILSLLFADTRICLHSAPQCLNRLKMLQERHFMVVGSVFVARTHKHYNDDNLIALYGAFNANKTTKSAVFCLQNDLEYTFHVTIKVPKTNKLVIIIPSIRDNSHGNNAKSFYDEILNSLQEGMVSAKIECEVVRYEFDELPLFFYSIEPNLLTLALSNVVSIFEENNYPLTFQQYLQTWYKPTLLSSQFRALANSC